MHSSIGFPGPLTDEPCHAFELCVCLNFTNQREIPSNNHDLLSSYLNPINMNDQINWKWRDRTSLHSPCIENALHMPILKLA